MKRIKRVFVANRGEIALRIVSACQELGLETVVGTSDADRDGLAARRADQAVCIGPAPAARATCATTWSCRPRSGPAATRSIPATGSWRRARSSPPARTRTGSTFIGPPPEVMELSGDKLRAREEAARAGVPVLRGQEIAPGDDARHAAARIGYPLLVKAAGGGGGRGIKLARNGAELGRLLGLARSEAGAAFGDDRVYLERFVAARAPRRGPDRRRRARRGRPPRRARLLGAAPLSEGDRGGAGAGLEPRDPQRARCRGRGVRDGDRLPQPRDGRVRARRRHRRVLLPRDQLPDPGRAPGHRGGHGARSGSLQIEIADGEPLGFAQERRRASTATRSNAG